MIDYCGGRAGVPAPERLVIRVSMLNRIPRTVSIIKPIDGKGLSQGEKAESGDDDGEGTQELSEGGVVAGVEDLIGEEGDVVAFVVGAVPGAAGGGEFVSGEAREAIRAVVDAQQSGWLGEVVRAGDEDVAVAKAGNAESDGVGVGDAEGAVEAAAAGDGGDGGEGGGGRG